MRLSDAPGRFAVLVAMASGSRLLGYVDSLEHPAELLGDDMTNANILIADTRGSSTWLVRGNRLADYPG